MKGIPILLALLFIVSIGSAQAVVPIPPDIRSDTSGLDPIPQKADTTRTIILNLDVLTAKLSAMDISIKNGEDNYNNAVNQIRLWTQTRDEVKATVDNLKIQRETLKALLENPEFRIKPRKEK